MRSKIVMLALTVSAVVAAGLFLPNLTYAEVYAGQMGSSQATFGTLAGNVGTPAPILTVRDGHGHGSGSWHGAARSFNGGREFHQGFRGRGYSYAYPFYDQYYVNPGCTTVWDSDLDEWVCAEDYDTY
jgi:hypothetical protein